MGKKFTDVDRAKMGKLHRPVPVRSRAPGARKKMRASLTPAEVEDLKDGFLIKLREYRGIQTRALEDMQITRSMVERWRSRDSDFDAAVIEIEETAIDFVEEQLFAHMKRGSTAAVIFYLKTKAKHRGYIERSELQVESNTLSGKVDPSKLSTEALKEILKTHEIKQVDE